MESNGNINKKGRKRVAMKKIEKGANLQVTFSKRRRGVFKKAFELSVLTGAQIGLIIPSPSGRRIYAYGHPSIETVIDRFCSGNSQPSTEQQRNRAPFSEDFSRTLQSLNNLRNQLNLEEKRGANLDNLLIDKQIQPVKGIDRQTAGLLQAPPATLRDLNDKVQRVIAARSHQGLQNCDLTSNSAQPGLYGNGGEISILDYYPHGGTVNADPSFVGVTNFLNSGSSGGPFVSGPSSFVGVGTGANIGSSSLGGNGSFGVPINIGSSLYGNTGSGWKYEVQPGLVGRTRPHFVGRTELIGGGTSGLPLQIVSTSNIRTADGWQYNAQPTSVVGGGSYNSGSSLFNSRSIYDVGLNSSGDSNYLRQYDTQPTSAGSGRPFNSGSSLFNTRSIFDVGLSSTGDSNYLQQYNAQPTSAGNGRPFNSGPSLFNSRSIFDAGLSSSGDSNCLREYNAQPTSAGSGRPFNYGPNLFNSRSLVDVGLSSSGDRNDLRQYNPQPTSAGSGRPFNSGSSLFNSRSLVDVGLSASGDRNDFRQYNPQPTSTGSGRPFNSGPNLFNSRSLVDVGLSSSGDRNDLRQYNPQPTSTGSGRSFNAGPSLFNSLSTFDIGSSSSGGGNYLWQSAVHSSLDGGGQYNVGPNSLIGSGDNGPPFIVGQSLVGDGNDGWHDLQSSLADCIPYMVEPTSLNTGSSTIGANNPSQVGNGAADGANAGDF